MSPERNQPPEGISWNSKLWRYMSLAKFISMLCKKEIYFCRIDRLDDIREAMLSPKTLDANVREMLANEEIQRALGDRDDGEEIAILVNGTSDMILRASTFVNCWYRSEVESVAMWQTYGRDGIAIQSTWKRLTESLPDDVFGGQVLYVDYNSTAIDPHMPFLYKDRIYEGEQEVRLMIRRSPREPSILAINRDHPTGEGIKADLDRLVKRIYVAPGSSGWLKDVVEDILAKYGLGQKEVITSGADQYPEYRRMYSEAREYLIDKKYPLEKYVDDYPPDDPWGLVAAQRTLENA